MGIEATLKALLSPLVSGRVYPDTTDGVALPLIYPLIIYQQVGGQAFEFLEGTLPSQDNARIQIVVWAKTRSEASSVARSVREAMVTSLKASSLGAPVSLYVSDLKNYGSRTDYSIWFTP